MATITKTYHQGRKSPFQASWTIERKRYSKFFGSEDEREQFILNIPNEGEEAFSLFKLSQSTIRDIAKIEKERGEVLFSEIWDFWKRNHKTQISMPLWDAANAYIHDLQNSDKCKEYVGHAIRILTTLCDSYGDMQITAITRRHLEDWIRDLPYGAVTKKNYRSTVRACWGYFERQEWIERNIATRLHSERIVREEIEFLTVEETEKLLRANETKDPEVCGLIALGFFAGMRTSAICRVAYDEINFERKGILTPASKTKKKRRNYIENLPDNLWEWLERTPPSAFGWAERKWKKRRETALRRAGLLVNSADVKRLAKADIKAQVKLPPKNALRHSFASYHVAWKRDFQDTALIMSHKGTGILFDHYKGNASQEDAERYFNIFPSPLK